jgi:hypothetical protein
MFLGSDGAEQIYSIVIRIKEAKIIDEVGIEAPRQVESK